MIFAILKMKKKKSIKIIEKIVKKFIFLLYYLLILNDIYFIYSYIFK